MSIPSYPVIYISQEDRANFKKPKVADESAVIIDSFFNTLFHINSNTIKKTGNIAQLSLNLTKYNGHMLLNSTVEAGTIPVGFRPFSAISGTFPYMLSIGDTGAIDITADGTVYVRSGDNAYIADTTVFTISIMYLV